MQEGCGSARPTKRDIEAVGYAVTKLSQGARRVVAGILGAPSDEHFLEAVNGLTPDSLFALRQKLRRMGM